MASETVDVAVVGGGLAGLTAATVAARRGARVTLLERSAELGGRARTQEEGGFLMNLGPHALYDGGAARRVLDEFGVTYTGGNPRIAGAVYHRGKLHTAPAGVRSLIATTLFGPGSKLQAGRFLAKLPRIDATQFDSMAVDEWLAKTFKRQIVRQFVAALFRLSTYTNAPAIQSAGAALQQFQGALKPVLYLDGGWQTLVDQLEAKARDAGVEIRPGSAVESIRPESGDYAVYLRAGTPMRAHAVVVTGSPAFAAEVLPAIPAASSWQQPPVVAACLDVGLSRLPVERTFTLGIDRPLYMSVHTAVARLAPQGKALVSVAKYIPVGQDNNPEADLRELEGLLDVAQPGWRDLLETRRFLPSMIVTHSVPAAATGGFRGRPGIDAAGLPGLFVAGDWVGSEGNLSDVSFASGHEAGTKAAEFARIPAPKVSVAAAV